jgi:hypothetical protein
MHVKILIVIGSFLFSGLSFGQGADSTRVDPVFNYEVKIPGWLHVTETGSPTIFGGTLPAVNGIENAISVQGFPGSQFKSFDEFKFIFLTGNKFGAPAKFDKEQTWYGQNELIEIDHGVRQKVFIYWQNKIYHNQFVLLRSGTAYILVQFVATPETYDINLPRFEEFLSGLKIKRTS